ncbi:MAG TPA: magnesium chelatase domain-containing protein [Candidatus Acidoferrales bacterium]|nr:magnesium chelatase domain-containing protein [Candidatus Acidoferrales bacterium]
MAVAALAPPTVARVPSCALWGLEAAPVTVEVDVANGLPNFQVVGLPDAAVSEARERVRAAIRNSGFEFPLRRVVANLAPAERRKEGSGFDLAIALGVLRATGQLSCDVDALCLGELALGAARGTGARRGAGAADRWIALTSACTCRGSRTRSCAMTDGSHRPWSAGASPTRAIACARASRAAAAARTLS